MMIYKNGIGLLLLFTLCYFATASYEKDIFYDCNTDYENAEVHVTNRKDKILQQEFEESTMEFCRICYDSLPILLKPRECHDEHLYCYNCINEWYQTNGKCPLCQKELQNPSLLQIGYDFKCHEAAESLGLMDNYLFNRICEIKNIPYGLEEHVFSKIVEQSKQNNLTDRELQLLAYLIKNISPIKLNILILNENHELILDLLKTNIEIFDVDRKSVRLEIFFQFQDGIQKDDFKITYFLLTNFSGIICDEFPHLLDILISNEKHEIIRGLLETNIELFDVNEKIVLKEIFFQFEDGVQKDNFKIVDLLLSNFPGMFSELIPNLIQNVTSKNMVKTWIKHNIDLNLQTPKERQTMLTFAVKAGNVGMVRLLLENKANFEFVDNHVKTPLWYALGKIDDIEILEKLMSPKIVNSGAVLYCALPEGELIFAGDNEIAWMDVKIFQEQSNDETLEKRPLYLKMDSIPLIRLMDVMNVNKQSMEILNRMPIHEKTLDHGLCCALQTSKYEWIEKMIELVQLSMTKNQFFEFFNASTINTLKQFLWKILYAKNAHMLNVLTRKPTVRLIDINLKNEQNQSLLHIAVAFKDENLTQILLTHGANPNIQNSKNQTPLHIACKTGNENIIIQLLKKNAYRFVVDIEGKIPGDYSKGKIQEGMQEMITSKNKILIKD